MTARSRFGPEPPGASPLEPDDADGLLLPGITTRDALNAVEQANILDARRWCLRGRRATRSVVETRFLRELHRRMFGAVWSWAGDIRTTDTNVGVPWADVTVALRNASADATVWIASPPWPWTELAVRWHHRLVVIHPFRNGNGRWSRLAADTLLRSAGEPELSWGKASLGDDGLARSRYLEALRLADAGELGPLVAFARS